MKKIIICLVAALLMGAFMSVSVFADAEVDSVPYCDISALTFDEYGNPTHDENGEELILGLRLWEDAYVYIRQDYSAVSYGIEGILDNSGLEEYYPLIKTLYISDYTKFIGSLAFDEMTSLEKVRFGNGLKLIEKEAFPIGNQIEFVFEGEQRVDFLVIEDYSANLLCDGLFDVYENVIFSYAENKYYYKSGSPYFGFFEYDGETYYCLDDGVINYETELEIDGATYFFEDGKLVEGPVYSPEWIKEHIISSGMRGWVEFEGKTYYVSLVSGVFNEAKSLKIGGVKRLFNDDYSVREGLLDDGDALRFYEKGVYKIGWVDTDGDGTKESYFLSANGAKVTNGRTIGGRVYDWENGVLTLRQGLFRENGDSYYYRDGKKIYGFVEIEGKKYYFLSSSFKMITAQSYRIGGFYREFNSDHSVKPISGWQEKNGNRYYYENGEPVTGFKEIGGYTYYFQKSDHVYGVMASGWISIGGDIYYFFRYGTEKYGRMVTGRQVISQRVYYFNSDGTINTGFVADKNGNVRYYYYAEVLKGWYRIGDETYYFSKEHGHMVTGEKSIGGVVYTFTDAGVLVGPSHDATQLGASAGGGNGGFDIGSGDWSDIQIFG